MANLPQSTETLKQLFQEAGIVEYEPQLLVQMCDFAYALTKQVLVEARSISEFSGKKQLDRSDVDFALKAFNEKYYKERPTKSLMTELATEKNAQNLPQIRQNYGLRLQNDRFCQLQPNYVHLGNSDQQPTKTVEGMTQATQTTREAQHRARERQQKSDNLNVNNFNPELVSNLLMGRHGSNASRKRPHQHDDSADAEQVEADDDYD